MRGYGKIKKYEQKRLYKGVDRKGRFSLRAERQQYVANLKKRQTLGYYPAKNSTAN